MKKIFILLTILFVVPSCSWIASAIDESIQKKEEEKQREIAQKNIDELRKKQALEKENRLNELIALYDKGLTKDISKQDVTDFDLYIEDIRKIDNKKAVNIDMFLCDKHNMINACFRTVEYYAKHDEIHEKLQNDIIELYDHSIMEKLKHNQVMKFNLTIADFEDCIDQKDEIDSSFKGIIESAIKNHIITLTFGMTIKEKGLPSKITSTIRYLFRFVTAGKISILENEKINEYNLLNHKIQYKYNLGKDETVHLNYDNMLLQGLNWLKEMYERDRGNT